MCLLCYGRIQVEISPEVMAVLAFLVVMTVYERDRDVSYTCKLHSVKAFSVSQ